MEIGHGRQRQVGASHAGVKPETRIDLQALKGRVVGRLILREPLQRVGDAAVRRAFLAFEREALRAGERPVEHGLCLGRFAASEQAPRPRQSARRCRLR